MVVQRYLQTFCYHDADHVMYAITNNSPKRCIDASGDRDKPGLNIRIPGLTRKSWEEKYWGLLKCDQLGTQARNLSDDVIKEILFCIFSGESAGVDWKITSVGVRPGGWLAMTLESAGLYRLNDMLSGREYELREQSANTQKRPDLTSWIPPDTFLLYWDTPYDGWIDFCIKKPKHGRYRYEIRCTNSWTEVREISKKRRRTLEFPKTSRESPDNEYSEYVDVVVTESFL